MLGDYALGQLAIGEAADATSSQISAEVGAFTLTGQAALFSISTAADVGAFAVSGQSALSTVSMPAAVGAFTLSGQSAAIAPTFVLTAEATPSAAANANVLFSALGEMAIGQGTDLGGGGVTFVVTGQESNVVYGLGIGVGAFTISGQAAGLVEGYVFPAAVGAFTLSGQAVGLPLSMRADAGAFLLTGQAVELSRPRSRIRAFPRVGMRTISARPVGREMGARIYGG